MATTSYGVNDALAVKLWSKRLDVEVLPDTHFARFMSASAGSLAQNMTETEKGPGDQVTWGIRMLAAGEGKTENETLEGNEESLTKYSDAMVINQLRHAHRVKGKHTIDAQRVPYDLREECYESLKDWYADRLDTSFFNVLAGNTAQTNTKYTGFNSPLAPSTNRLFRGGSALATDQAVGADTTATFKLSLIDKCVNRAKTADTLIRPVKGLGKNVDYVLFIHPDQVLSLRQDASTAGNWFDLQLKRLSGGEGDANGLYDGAIGIYNRTLVLEANRIPNGVHGTTAAAVSNTRRAVFCGAQAMGVAFGQKGSKTKFQWVEDLFDYENELGVAASNIFGMKKTRYNGEDYGTITVTTYAAPAS